MQYKKYVQCNFLNVPSFHISENRFCGYRVGDYRLNRIVSFMCNFREFSFTYLVICFTSSLLNKLGYDNVFVRIGDGYQGWKEHAPFDAIIVTCAPTKIPKPLTDQLAEGGRMIIPVGEKYVQELVLLHKKNNQLIEKAVLPVLFVPMVDQHGKAY